MGSWNFPALFWSATAQARYNSDAAAIMVGSLLWNVSKQWFLLKSQEIC